ncbi:MAG: tetratricopeptide repeat protein [Elusimicrobia bacterium]|nr:tetratricopeptide repeat protein [Elusimicrobiota bacterium]
MSAEKEETSWGSVAVLLVAGIVVVVLVWRSYQNDAPGITTYQAPAAAPAGAPRAETAPSLAALAESAFNAGRYDEAISAYRKMLALDPNDAGVYTDLGLALHYSGKADEAVAALKKATALEPKGQRAWLSYGFVLKASGREKPARAALEKTVALDPATAQGIEAKGMLKR